MLPWNRPCETELRDSLTGSRLYQTRLKYNKLNQLEQFAERVGSDTHTTKYAYDRDNRVTEIQYDGTTHKVGYSYDALGRLSTRTVESGDSAGTLTSTYTYVDGGYGTNSTTPLVKKITQNGISFEYTYDSRGNITSEKRGSLTTSYEYDLLGRLTRINDPHDTTAESYGTTWLFHYDLGGNIIRKTPYAYTTSGSVGFPYGSTDYEYGDSNWRDKLTVYNGVSITYDAIGNPLNDGTWTYTWAAGRQLQSMSKAGTTVQYQYDHNGLRTRKTATEGNATTVTDYILHGKLVTHMTVSKTVGGVTTQDTLHFFYDAQSRPAKVSYNGTMYTYLHNLQGDVVGILDSAGTLVVEYKYDAWGRALSTVCSLTTELAEENPFRYRGYIYDEEIGLYYLRSRYYNPTWYRFVNRDSLLENKGSSRFNLFVYVGNNPTAFKDASGQRAVSIKTDNWIEKTVQETMDNQASMAINSYCSIVAAFFDYLEITKKKLRIPLLYLDGKRPKSTEATNYTVSRWHTNVVGGIFTSIANILSQERMGDFINTASIFCTGTPLVGSTFDNTMAIVSELSSRYVGDVHSVYAHTLTIEYKYEAGLSLVMNYTFYSSGDNCVDHYDGIHAFGVILIDGWCPRRRVHFDMD